MAVQWEYKVGPLTINFRALLEPKGFLRILMVIISILAFSITAGYTDGPNDNSLSCVSANNVSHEVKLEFVYPFQANNFKAVYSPNDEFIANSTRNTSSCGTRTGFKNRSFSGLAQFFVAMGIFSFLYCLGIVFVYVLFVTQEFPFVKWILIFDFIASIVFAFLLLLADIMWSAGIAGMRQYIETELERRGEDCLQCQGGVDVDAGLYAQPAVSVIFGWLLCIVWFSSLWFTYKDTHWHKDRTGPLAPAEGEQGATPGPPQAPDPQKVTGEY